MPLAKQYCCRTFKQQQAIAGQTKSHRSKQAIGGRTYGNRSADKRIQRFAAR
ncbi:MAG: hypothetical protein KME42_26075 [Tildeniella nuda ZEHNDER 1965/U140]|nr:hypothetical protein [Tildeniella nuda ZEHNDER 1965/U140]